MFIVSEINLIKESGAWEEDTMCGDQNCVEFENLADAQNYYNSIDPKDIYTTEKNAGPHFKPFGYGVKLAEENDGEGGWIEYNLIDVKQYTSDDDVDDDEDID